MTVANTLYYGDNLDVLRRYVADESVDLIYLDPPFNSKATYNVLFAEQNGSRSASQIKAFDDTWRWDQAAAEAYQEIVEAGGVVSQIMQAFRQFLGHNNMLAYLSMMALRLVELRRVLKPTGSIYLHCDPTASHFLKLLMDAVFGAKNFQNEIIWSFKSGGATKKRFARKHQTIFFYSKDSKRYKFNILKEKSYNRGLKPYRFKGVEEYQDEIGWYTLVNMKDVWQIDMVGRTSSERLGYPTQKPEALLERIILASSDEGDLVLDPFCGCGTTIVVAERLKRRWIGIDITHIAINLMKNRQLSTFGEEILERYQTLGEPTSLPDAKALAAEDRFQFQWWALGLVGARPVEKRRGADQGIDGRLYFHDGSEKDKTSQVIISVKSGKVAVSHIRDLLGVLERENAEIGVLITMQKPTQSMRSEAAGAGFYISPWGNKKYPRLQILTIEELLSGKRIEMPPLRQVNTTFKKARRAKGGGSSPPMPRII